MILEAVFGAHLPQRLRIVRWPVRASVPEWLELRTYACEDPERLAAMLDRPFKRTGIHPLRLESERNLTFLIPFESLAQRNQAWTWFDAQGFSAEGQRMPAPLTVTEITIYRPIADRPQPGGRIFERSL